MVPLAGTYSAELGLGKAHLEMFEKQLDILEIEWKQNGKG